MPDIFSSHAPNNQPYKAIVSPNEFSSEGRNIGFPSKFSVYVNKLASSDGSANITETRSTADIVGNRLYLYHRPLLNADGTVTTINVSSGSLDTTLTNPKQGYVVFSSLPSTSTFTVNYFAAPDSISMWYLNTVQDDIMEIEKTLGVTSQTGYPGLRNLAYALFDKPDDANIQNVAQRAIFLGHLDRNIFIGSTDDATLSGTLGNSHNIQIGRVRDTVTFDVDALVIQQSNASRTTRITLGTRTGDYIFYSGQISGAGPITIGGPAWSNYSGVLGGSLTTGFYLNSMLRVNGDVAVLGDLQSVGSLTVVNLTGEVSTVIGDFTITNDLRVQGSTRLIGPADVNNITVEQDETIYGDIIAGNQSSRGGNGHSLVDNLDASEVAHTYRTVMRKVLPNTVLNGRPLLSQLLPARSGYTFGSNISGSLTCGDQFVITGFATATAGPSGSHPNIIQVNFTDYPLPVVSGTYSGINGGSTGIWSPGMMDPGTLWIEDLNSGFKSPIYGYTIESGSAAHIVKLNVFCPELVTSTRVQTNDSLLLYYPNARPYNFLSAASGASPTASIFASSAYPFEVAFDDEVRKTTSSSPNFSIKTALEYSITGLTGNPTGVAYIFATNTNDIELSPGWKSRNIPYRMPGEVAVGEVKAFYSGSQWHILESVSYRPGAVYDSAWVPIVSYTGSSGRSISAGLNKLYFRHDFGPSVDNYRMSTDLYLASYGSVTPVWDQAQPLGYSLSSRDSRANLGFSGFFTKVPLTTTQYSGSTNTLTASRDASVFYLDGRYIGVQFSSDMFDPIIGGQAPTYARLVVRRDA